MTVNEKINEALAIISHLNYRLNNNDKDRRDVEEWICDLKNEVPENERIAIDSAELIKFVRRHNELQQADIGRIE